MKNFFVTIYKSCMSHDIFDLAASISFYAILSLLPLTMVFVSAIVHVMGSETVVTQIVDSVTAIIPGAKEIFSSNLQNLIKSKSSLGMWGISFLLVISTVLFSSLENAFDKVFETVKRRNFFHSRLLAIGVIFIILVLLFVPSSIRVLESVLVRYGYSIPLYNYISGSMFFVIFAMVSYLVTIIIVPNQKIYLRYAFWGACFYAAGIAVAKYLFSWYISITFDRYNLIYGSLTAIILTVLWVYYLSIILLVSAELVAYLQKRRVR